MILEVVRADGRRSWHRLADEMLPLTLGRGFSNDLILDDPYVDARHARIAVDGPGALRVEDLGSVNGVIADDSGRLPCVAVRAGTQLRVGRTTLHFRDPEEDVAPALLDERVLESTAVTAPALAPLQASAPLEPPRDARAIVGRLLATLPGRLLVVAAGTGAFALNTWLANAARSSASAVLSAALGFVLMVAVWAALWSAAARVVLHRAHFSAHLAIGAASVIGMLVCSTIGEWVAFVFPDATVASLVPSALTLALTAAMIAGHLAYSSTMGRRRRWSTGGAVAAVLVAIGGALTLAKADTFSDAPSFSAVLKPVPAAWLPTKSVAEFSDAMRDAQREVDELAADQAKRDAPPAGAGR